MPSLTGFLVVYLQNFGCISVGRTAPFGGLPILGPLMRMYWYNVLPYVTLADDRKMPAFAHSCEVHDYMPETDLVDPFKIAEFKRRRTCEPVDEQILQAIFSGLLVSGHKLPSEWEMAESFQTSRVAVREALRALEKEDLITIKRGSGGGAFVANFDSAVDVLAESLDTVVKLGSAKRFNSSEIRSILEPETTHLATLRATPQDISAIEAMVIAQEQELEGGELSPKRDMDFHRCVAEAAHNPVMKIVMNAVNESIREPILRSRRSEEMRKHVVTCHRNIFRRTAKRQCRARKTSDGGAHRARPMPHRGLQ
jgi:GntR family transcriptional repressor for pyruvate dehydrogenase complex